MNRWQEVWQRKGLAALDTAADKMQVLQQLIAIDGWDTNLQRAIADDWMAYVNRCVERLGITATDSVFEVGCGAGAFLYCLCDRVAKVAGLDYAPSMQQMISEVIPRGHFVVAEAKDMNVEPQYDYLIANYVLTYFHDYDYARAVMDKMFTKAKKGIGIFQVSDLVHREALMKERMAAHQGEEEYKAKYEGLDQLFYAKHWFADLASEHGWTCKTIDNPMPEYPVSRFRYDVIMHAK